MGQQMNLYRSAALIAELDAEAIAQTKASASGHQAFTAQDLLRMAWAARPKHLRLAERDVKKGAR